ncbi:hypothetical protein LBMAG42_39120 [Deltaproteobacteria bacterium]|nr:hypothetical protein LBMAG42_39120 [Deltaproteobacteria bacterium]
MRPLPFWLLLLSACDEPLEDSAAPITPESIAATAKDGDAVEARGFVHTLTYDTWSAGDTGEGEEGDGEEAWTRKDGRWLLFRSVAPEGVAYADVNADLVTEDATILLGWGLGVALSDTDARPRIDDEIEVSGTFRWSTWNDHPVPVVEDATVTVVTGATPGAAGETCASDDDCADTLVCDRATTTCAAAKELGWGALWRDVDGSCYSDADCPLGQTCDTSFVVPDSGEYTWRFDAAHKQGASLCVPTVNDPDTACPRAWSTRDVAGGRFTEGREVCVDGDVQLNIGASDGDTHLQLRVDEPIPYPMMDAHIYLFGATTEIGPAHKNPDRPQGAVLDPDVGQHIRVLGTMRWDGDHGWYEVHPVKQWWVVE